MSELSIISQKAGPLGEKSQDFSDFAGGNPFKSVNNTKVIGAEEDIIGQSLTGKIPSPLSPVEIGPSKLEYPIDVSGNPAYSATVKFQVVEYTTSSPGKSQKNHITSATDNINALGASTAKVEDDIGLDAFGGAGDDVALGVNTGSAFADDAGAAGYAGTSSTSLGDFSDFSGTNTFKAKIDAEAEANEIKKSTASTNSVKLGFFPKPNSPIINMYFPASQAFVDGVQYGDANLGAIGGAALGALQAGQSGIGAAVDQGLNAVNDVKNAILDTIKSGQVNVARVAESEAARLAASRLIDNTPGISLNKGFGAAAGIANRIIVNPNVRKLFSGVTVREFTFQFKFIPTSPEEAEVIQKIVKLFRTELYPRAFKIPIGGESSVSLGYNFPNAFRIKFNFKDTENRNIPKLLECYLRNVTHTINPTGGGFKNDGKPNEIDLTLSFVEHRALEQQDIEKGF